MHKGQSSFQLVKVMGPIIPKICDLKSYGEIRLEALEKWPQLTSGKWVKSVEFGG